MAKYYAVKNGRKPGIYSSWDECKKQVEKFKGAIYKSFTSLEDAKVFIKEEKIEFDGGLIAYVDGSYNIKTHEYGFGCVIIEEQKVIKEMYGKGADENYASMRNVAGEILGSICAMEFAKNNGYKQICIYFDYEGIEKWATGVWTAKNPHTKKYAAFMRNMQEKMEVIFQKVRAHSGDYYNEQVDQLAKKALINGNGIPAIDKIKKIGVTNQKT